MSVYIFILAKMICRSVLLYFLVIFSKPYLRKAFPFSKGITQRLQAMGETWLGGECETELWGMFNTVVVM